MTDPTDAAPLPAVRVRVLGVIGVLSVAMAAGFVGGALEVAIALVRRAVAGRLLLFGDEMIWLTPLTEAAIFGLVGGLYVLIGAVIVRIRRPVVTVAAFGSLALCAALSQIDALHPGASVVLAVGLGTAAARLLGRGGTQAEVLAGRLLAVGLIGVVLTGGLMTWREARHRPQTLGPVAVPGRPNVLLLVLDTVRAWNLSLYGHARSTTPRLEARFRDGIVFDRALATAPWTLPSHASLFTGRQPFVLSAGWDRALDGSRSTLAEVLAAAGYATGGFVGNYRYAGGATGLGRGFARYDDYPIDVAEALRMTGLVRRILRIGPVQTWLGRNRIVEARSAASVNSAFLNWLDDNPDRPFFSFINYVDAHSPYLPPAPFDSLWVSDPAQVSRGYAAEVAAMFGRGPIPPDLLVEFLDGYDGALSYLDQQIDALLEELERRGLLDNTIVVLTSDHGEHFGEHGLIQHGNSLYLPLLHVPLAVYGPRFVPRGLRIAEPTSLVNVAATITDLAGVAAPMLGGHSLAPLWGPDSLTVPIEDPVAAVDWHKGVSRFPPSTLLGGSLRSVLRDNLHYIRRSDGAEELYEVSRDFLEVHNLVGQPGYRPALLEIRTLLDSATAGRTGPGPRPMGN